MRIFAAAYGLPGTNGLVDRVARRQRLDAARVKLLAGKGVEPQRTWVAEGMLAQVEARAVWTERNRSLLE